MITLSPVTIPDLLNKKFLQWQLSEGAKRRTLDDFSEYLSVKRPTLSAWMNGSRVPGGSHKHRLIELFGKEAIEAFGEDPDLHAVTQNWEHLSPEARRAIREQAEKLAAKNDTKRTPAKRRTSTP